MEKTRTVKTGAGDVVVRKLALYDYAEFIRALRKLPGELADLFKSGKNVGDMAVLFEEIPELIADSWDDFVAIIAVGTDKDAEFFKSPDLDGADALDIIDALMELNDYERIVNTVKKIMARRQSTPTSPATSKPNSVKPQ
jgi:hypothetical protein